MFLDKKGAGAHFAGTGAGRPPEGPAKRWNNRAGGREDRMLARAILGVAVVAGAALFSAHNVLEGPGPDALQGEGAGTLALAPISLGNPAAAATLKTRLPAIPHEETAAPEPYGFTARLKKGGTLAGLLGANGVDSRTASAAVSAMTKVFSARRLRAGQDFRLSFAAEHDGRGHGRFLGFSFIPTFDKEVRVWRGDGERFAAVEKERPLTIEMGRADGVIDSSLYLSGSEAGLPAATLVELIRIFSWDVDFQREIRSGDRFEVMYEQAFDPDGRLVNAGRIMFAALTLSGERKTMYLFRTDKGREDYFNAMGQGARKALLRTPIDGARLSSGYGRRRHPILGYTKKHNGIDFAAPRGTPIYAGGDGVITYRGRKGGYGNYIRIRHTNGYSTAYAHMKSFARGMTKGKRVRQGQVIGYVGSTGRSTGPHLHYEILVNNRHVNPLRVKMPSGRKLKGGELERFLSTRQELDAKYAALATGTTVAANSR